MPVVMLRGVLTGHGDLHGLIWYVLCKFCQVLLPHRLVPRAALVDDLLQWQMDHCLVDHLLLQQHSRLTPRVYNLGAAIAKLLPNY